METNIPSHLESFRAWCDMVGLRYFTRSGRHYKSEAGLKSSATSLEFHADMGIAAGLDGYKGFEAAFHFDEAGSFLVMDIYE